MDLTSFRRRFSPPKSTDQPLFGLNLTPATPKRFGFFTDPKLPRFLAACLILVTFFLTLSLIYGGQPSDLIFRFADARALEFRVQSNATSLNHGQLQSKKLNLVAQLQSLVRCARLLRFWFQMSSFLHNVDSSVHASSW